MLIPASTFFAGHRLLQELIRRLKHCFTLVSANLALKGLLPVKLSRVGPTMILSAG